MAWTLWKEGASGDPGILEASRLLDLEASLLRDQGEVQAALERLDQALNLCESPSGRSRIILKKAATLVTMGDYDDAVSTFEAESLIDATREPRDLWAINWQTWVFMTRPGEP
jgi:tetratricopeptide (TPR) repeat protein